MDEIDINEDLRCDKMISYYDELMKKANIDNEIDKNIKNSLIKGVFDKKKEDK